MGIWGGGEVAMPSVKETADQKRWRAEEDAHTLARAEEIRGDQRRLGAATTQAQRMASEKMKQAAAMQTIAKFPPKKKPMATVVLKKKVAAKKVKKAGVKKGGKNKRQKK